jgi:hypothetical protein
MRKFCRPIEGSDVGLGREEGVSDGVEMGWKKTGMRGWSGIAVDGTVVGLSAMVGIPSTGSNIPSG